MLTNKNQNKVTEKLLFVSRRSRRLLIYHFSVYQNPQNHFNEIQNKIWQKAPKAKM